VYEVRLHPEAVRAFRRLRGAVRDRIVKRDLHGRHGVPEYWIADPGERTIEALELEGGRYRSRGICAAGDAIESPHRPGLRLSVGELFD